MTTFLQVTTNAEPPGWYGFYPYTGLVSPSLIAATNVALILPPNVNYEIAGIAFEWRSKSFSPEIPSGDSIGGSPFNVALTEIDETNQEQFPPIPSSTPPWIGNYKNYRNNGNRWIKAGKPAFDLVSGSTTSYLAYTDNNVNAISYQYYLYINYNGIYYVGDPQIYNRGDG